MTRKIGAVRQATVLVLVVVALLLVGCGGGSKRLSRQEFDSKGNAICAKFNAKQHAVPNPKSLADLGPALRKLLPLAKQQLAELSKLKPPKEDDAIYQSLLANARQENDFVEHKLLPAVDKNDLGVVQNAVNQLQAMDRGNNAKARQIGLNTCAQSA